MWDAVIKLLSGSNALIILIFLVLVTFIFAILAKGGFLQIRTSAFSMGSEARERDIIRQQIEWTYSFVTGLYGEIEADETEYKGYLTKYILERCYDEIVNWISFNHINLDSDYISIKQEKIKSIIKTTQEVRPEYKSKEFEKRIDSWVEEVIKKLVLIREMYK